MGRFKTRDFPGLLPFDKEIFMFAFQFWCGVISNDFFIQLCFFSTSKYPGSIAKRFAALFLISAMTAGLMV